MLSIVIPTYNRSKNLIENVEKIDQVLSREGLVYELIFVDDGSLDDTKDILKVLSEDVENISGIVLAGNSGQQNATLAGIRQAKYAFVMTMDDDLSYNPLSIVALYKEMEKGYSVVYGVPVDKHHRFHRNVGTMIKEMIFFLLLRKPFGIRLTSFRIMTRQVADYVGKDGCSKVYISARTLKLTKNIGNLQVIRLTKGETSHYNLWKLIHLLLGVVSNYSFISPLFKSDNKKQYEIKEIF